MAAGKQNATRRPTKLPPPKPAAPDVLAAAVAAAAASSPNDWTMAPRYVKTFDTPTTPEVFARTVKTYLTPADHAAFERATGGPIAAVLAHPWWRASTAYERMATMSLTKVLATPLNALGLQALRALVAERVQRRVALLRGATSHPWYEGLLSDGLLLFRVPLEQLRRGSAPGTHRLPPALESQLHSLLSSLSASFVGDTAEVEWTPWERIVSQSDEKQFYMHVDTFSP